ncbi:MAG: hypothetical protein JW807_00105 [Spirochaetes bacterium]|nr:hypothetical protein [Spirochaetota bacterium]
MKLFSLSRMAVTIMLVLVPLISCNNVDNLDDQAPVLIVNVETTDPTIIISSTNKVYVVYYADEDWQNPYLQHGTDSQTIITPTVTSYTVYVAVFWDADGNGVLDPGEPCTGYMEADHSLGEPIDKLSFFPLEWRIIHVTLDSALRVY